MRVIFHTYLLVCLLGSVQAKGQSYAKDFNEISQAYYKSGLVLSWDVYYKYYNQPASRTAIDSMHSNFKLFGTSHYYYSFANQEFLKNKNYFLAVNHDSKLIMVDKSSRSQPPVFDIKILDSLVRTAKATVTSLPTNKIEKGYRISLKDKGEINQIDMWFHPSTLLISKIFLYYNEFKYGDEIHHPKVEIRYANYSKQSQEQVERIFAENKFIKTAGEKFIPSESLSGYTVINNMEFSNGSLK